MSYSTEEIKQGIKAHYIETNKFKTNLLAVFLTIPINKENVTKNALIPAVLRRGTANLKTQEEISIELENMYGASFDCGIEKTGDNHVLKFYMEVLNDEFIPENRNLLKESLKLILDIIFNPVTENTSFKKEYIDSEKQNLERIINSKIDNKDKYALDRCIEEMYKNENYGLYRYGYAEDLKNLNEKNLYDYYLELINSAKIDIFVSGDINKNEIAKEISENENIKKLNEREDKHIINNEETEIKKKVEAREIKESKDISQGKLVMGLDVHKNQKDLKYVIALYNVILGESATSKLFQNVREKASLAYSARSNYVRQKNNIYIRCGIEIENYDKAIKIIKEQLEDMKNGNFTDEDLQNAKKYIKSGIKTVEDEQDSEITYYIGQELSGNLTTFEEYAKKIDAVTKEQVTDIGNNIEINTIYFLKN